MSEQQPDDQGSGLTPPPEPPGAPTAWMPPPPTMPPPATSVWHRIAAYVVLVAVVAAAAGIGVGYSIARAVNPQQAAQASPITLVPGSSASPATNGNGNGNNNNSNGSTSVASKVEPAIVRIHTTVGSSAAAGTGMIISSNGEILTNNHVVSSSTSISVQVQGRSQTYTAHVVGVAVSQDVAVIQIDQNVSGLPTVKFADSSGVQVGDPVVAIGNALDNGTQANSGQVTAVDQTITASEGGGSSETLSGMIESDAIIYEGDSGGALVNSSGQVIGMITAGQAQGFRSSASSVGYAIQSNTAVGIADRIRNHEQASDLTYGQVGYLGVQVQTLDAAAAQQLNLNVTSGALVVQVQPGSPAASGGLTRNSVITSLGGTTITSADDLGTAIRSHQPGDRVSFTWVNSGGTHTATVALGGVNP